MIKNELLYDRIVIFIGGCWDRFSTIVSGYSSAYHRQHPEQAVLYFEYGQPGNIVAAALQAKANHERASLSLVGHSWGAVTAIEVVNRLAAHDCATDLLITVDPVSLRRKVLCAGPVSWVNIEAAPARSNGFNGDYYALLGGKWASWPATRAQVHYQAPFHHNEFAALLEYAPGDSLSAIQHLSLAVCATAAERTNG